MSFNPVAALAAYHAALDARDLKTVETMLSCDASYSSEGLGVVIGRDAIMKSLRDYFADCPDHQAFDDVVSADTDRVARSEWRLRATNRLTGVVIERRGIEIVTFDGDGRILTVVVEDAK